MKFLNYDSPFMIFLRKLVDYFSLGLLWIVFCIPVVTAGAATTAAFLTAELRRGKEEGPLFKNFWMRLLKEFKEATLLWFIYLPVTALIFYNIWLISNAEMSTWVNVMVGIASCVIYCWTQLWFGYLSKFEDRIKTVLGNTFRMSLANMGWVILLGVIGAIHLLAAAILFFLMPPLLLLLPGSYLMCYTRVIRKIFVKYIPQPVQEEAPSEA